MRGKFFSARLSLIIFILLFPALLAGAESVRLKCDGVQFPVFIDSIFNFRTQKIPSNPQTPTTYIFQTEDMKNNIAYTVSIFDFEDESFGRMTDSQNQETVDAILKNQIDILDSLLGVTSKILSSSPNKISGKIARTVGLLREFPEENFFCRYSSVVVNRYAVTVWSFGPDSNKTRSLVRFFTKSLKIKED